MVKKVSMRARSIALLCSAVLCWAPGCKKKGADDGNPTGSTPSAESAASTTTAPVDEKRPRLEPLPGGTAAVLKGYKPKRFQVPVGRPLGIFPGKGVGAVRFGATVETVERLVDAKCTEKTKQVCRYEGRAVDFLFDDQGGVREIRIHGDERKFSDEPGRTYGVYNGRFTEGAALGMYAPYVIKDIGEPKRVETIPDGDEKGPFPTMERHYYDDMVLEYDKLENGNVVLAGIILKRPQETAGASAGKAAGK